MNAQSPCAFAKRVTFYSAFWQRILPKLTRPTRDNKPTQGDFHYPHAKEQKCIQVIPQPKHFKRTFYNLNVSSLHASLASSRTLRSHNFTVFCPSVPVYIQCRLERRLTAKVLSGEEYFGTYSLIHACLRQVFNTTKDK